MLIFYEQEMGLSLVKFLFGFLNFVLICIGRLTS